MIREPLEATLNIMLSEFRENKQLIIPFNQQYYFHDVIKRCTNQTWLILCELFDVLNIQWWHSGGGVVHVCVRLPHAGLVEDAAALTFNGRGLVLSSVQHLLEGLQTEAEGHHRFSQHATKHRPLPWQTGTHHTLHLFTWIATPLMGRISS